MSASPNWRGLLLCTVVLVCTTVSDALVLLVLVPLHLLLCLTVSLGLSHLRLSTRTAVWVFAFGSGVAFLRLTAFTPYTVELTPISLATLLLCGAVTPSFLSTPPPPSVLWRTATVMLLTGVVREIVTEGCVLGLKVIEPLPIAPEPVGALLIAAFWLWALRMTVPVTKAPQKTLWNTVWLTLAVCSVKSLTVAFLPSLSDTWIMGLTVFAAALLSHPEPLRTAWAPLTPIIAWPVSDRWWHALVSASATALVLNILASLSERWRRVPIARSFSGSPAALTLTAIAWSVFLSF